MNSVLSFIKNSPKKLGKFNNIIQQQENYDILHRSDKALKSICPTRGVMLLPPLHAFMGHYSSILDFLEELKDDRSEPAENTECARPILGDLPELFCYELSKLYCLKFTQFMCYALAGLLLEAISEAGLALLHYHFPLNQPTP
ncbi:hypothetical protein LOD99_15099 [Oopsacas minuta]|uniref:Uncharacterized protein n=1 Tax=Oopsacas minuta TaxID=111878 RepID=A0AAV7KFD1_9METZ|nr:hypothetical protein LOD99_15099 [Oopsacas minuta]